MKKSKRRRRHDSYMRKWLAIGSYAGRCRICSGHLIYVFQYDAICCSVCNEWKEKKCGDPNCSYCSQRPDTPAECLMDVKQEVDKDYFIKKYEKRWKGRAHRQKKLSLIRKIKWNYNGD